MNTTFFASTGAILHTLRAGRSTVRRLMTSGSLVVATALASSPAGAQDVVKLSADDFHPTAGVITFSEFPLNSVNPTYNPSDYGGAATAPIVSFDGLFAGQQLSPNPDVTCPGAAATACVVGKPTASLSLDKTSPNVFITNDGSNPTSPVLSGSPTFNGPIAVLFSTDQAAVGFDGGYFDAVGSTGITAFARDGTLLGTVVNTMEGIEFLGLATVDGSAKIAGVFLDLVGDEPAGFAIDNVRFGLADQVTIPTLPPPPAGQYLFWDGDAAGNANNGVVDGGNGTWNATATNWTTAVGTPNGVYNPNPGTVTFAGVSGTVTVDDSLGAISVTGMNFTVDGYHIVGDPIGLSGGAATFSVGNGGEGDGSITATVDAVLTGGSGLTKTGAGTLVLGGINTYTGTTTVSAGTLIGSATSFGTGPVVDAGANFVINQPTDAAFGNTIAGTGTFLKIGAGTLTLNGTNAFTGVTGVAQGTLLVDGTLSGSTVTVGNGATLGGTGTVGGIGTHIGAIVAPGISIGTLTVAGNYVASAGSTFAVEVKSTGESDLLNITGTATVATGANLVVSKLDAARYVLGERYTVLAAAGGGAGAYTLSGDTNVSLFYNLVADYDATHVYLDVAQTSAFASAGGTPNQIAAADGADSAPGGLHDAIGYLQTVGDAQAAFDAISGEIYASERAVAFEDSRFVREAVYGRLTEPADSHSLWMHGFGSWGHMRGDGNAARYQRDTGGFFLGVDLVDHGSTRFGLLAGYGHSTLRVPHRASSASADDAYLGAYAGVGGGDFALRLGASYMFRSLSTSRSVAFTGFTDSLSSNSNLDVGQVFGEAGYKMSAGAAYFEPIASAALVRVSDGRTVEDGGAARLIVRGETSQIVFTNLGARFGAGAGKLKIFGSAGWRHAFQDRNVRVSMAFTDGDDFSIAAVPIAKDVAALEAGGQVAIARNGTLSVSYSGQTGHGLADNGVKAALRWAF